VRSAVVQQALADALGAPVRALRLRSASAIGAAVLAGRGIGLDVVPIRDVGPQLDPLIRAR
jgi:xylulokinase